MFSLSLMGKTIEEKPGHGVWVEKECKQHYCTGKQTVEVVHIFSYLEARCFRAVVFGVQDSAV